MQELTPIEAADNMGQDSEHLKCVGSLLNSHERYNAEYIKTLDDNIFVFVL